MTNADDALAPDIAPISPERWVGCPNGGRSLCRKYPPAFANALAVPVGLLSAIYLSEYAGRKFRAAAKPLLDAAVKDYASKNAPWPERKEPCDQPGGQQAKAPG